MVPTTWRSTSATDSSWEVSSRRASAWQPNLGARLYDAESPTGAQDLGVVGMGPVGFGVDGSPIQLVLSDDGATVTLTNLSTAHADSPMGAARRHRA